MLLSQNSGRGKLLKFLSPTNKVVIGNIYRQPYNSRDSLDTFVMEFNSTGPLENHANNSYVKSCEKNWNNCEI